MQIAKEYELGIFAFYRNNRRYRLMDIEQVYRPVPAGRGIGLEKNTGKLKKT
jgi:hypothetical protein